MCITKSKILKWKIIFAWLWKLCKSSANPTS